MLVCQWVSSSYCHAPHGEPLSAHRKSVLTQSIPPMSTFLALFTCNANLMGALSFPLPERRDAEDTTHWVSAPTTRGTFGLLLSCIVTLVLCLWTSLHLNIPKQGQGAVGRAVQKLGWTLLALFAPEVVVYVAWRQWVSANALWREVNGALEVCLSVSNPVERTLMLVSERGKREPVEYRSRLLRNYGRICCRY